MECFLWLARMYDISEEWVEIMSTYLSRGYRAKEVMSAVATLQASFRNEYRRGHPYSKELIRSLLQNHRAMSEEFFEATFRDYEGTGKSTKQVQSDLKVFLDFLQWLQ